MENKRDGEREFTKDIKAAVTIVIMGQKSGSGTRPAWRAFSFKKSGAARFSWEAGGLWRTQFASICHQVW